MLNSDPIFFDDLTRDPRLIFRRNGYSAEEIDETSIKNFIQFISSVQTSKQYPPFSPNTSINTIIYHNKTKNYENKNQRFYGLHAYINLAHKS
jgi:hypothetical protein